MLGKRQFCTAEWAVGYLDGTENLVPLLVREHHGAVAQSFECPAAEPVLSVSPEVVAAVGDDRLANLAHLGPSFPICDMPLILMSFAIDDCVLKKCRIPTNDVRPDDLLVSLGTVFPMGILGEHREDTTLG